MKNVFNLLILSSFCWLTNELQILEREDMIRLYKNQYDLSKILVLINCEDSHLEKDLDCLTIKNSLDY